MCNSANTPEHSAVHEVVGVGAEAIDDVVVIPDIDLGNLAVGSRKGLVAIPPDIVVVIVLVAFIAHLPIERIFASFVRVANVGPGLERAIYSHSVIVDLVASTDHHVKGSLLVHTEDIVPQYRPLPDVHIGAN